MKLTIPKDISKFVPKFKKKSKFRDYLGKGGKPRDQREWKVSKHIIEVVKRRELRDWWRKKIGKEVGVNWKRVCLVSKVSNKKLKPEYVIKTRG